ncbi:MAG: hypothetical protein ABH851_00835 [Methanobacteriota archaeon]
MNVLETLKSISKESIARRYFLMNTFDGSLTILGIILALHLAGASEAKIYIISCVGAAIAMGVSGVWGAYAAEKAERVREMKSLEKHVLRDLEGTRVERRLNRIVVLVALVDGASPLLAALIIISPYMISQLGLIGELQAFTGAIAIEIIILFGLGFTAGSISEEDRISNGLKMLGAGILVGVITILLEAVRVI